MIEYAKRECDNCLGIFPANELNRKKMTKEVARSVRRVDLNVQGDLFNPARTTSHTSSIDVFLCDSCNSKRRTRSLLKCFAIAGLLILAFVWWQSQDFANSLSSPLDELQSSSENDDRSIDFRTDDFEPETLKVESSPETFLEIDEPLLSNQILGQGLAVDANAEDRSLSLEETRIPENSGVQSEQISLANSAALSAAFEKALTKGKPIRWKDRGQSGYVVVSELGDKGCRDYYYTIDSDSQKWRSETNRHCPDND